MLSPPGPKEQGQGIGKRCDNLEAGRIDVFHDGLIDVLVDINVGEIVDKTFFPSRLFPSPWVTLRPWMFVPRFQAPLTAQSRRGSTNLNRVGSKTRAGCFNRSTIEGVGISRRERCAGPTRHCSGEAGAWLEVEPQFAAVCFFNLIFKARHSAV